MLNKSTVQKTMNVDIAISNEMSDFVERCLDIYQNNPPWRNDKKGIFSMNLGSGIASEFAKLVTIEFKSEISNNDFLNKEYQAVIDNVRNDVELACAGGGIIFKPYLSNGHIEVDIVQANAIYPVSFNSRGEMTACVLPETKTVGDYTYTRLEYHNFDSSINSHIITNKAFRKKNNNQIRISTDSSLGEEIQLSEVAEWSNIAPYSTISNVDRPLFSYFKMPNRNTVDLSSPLGVSIFARVAEDNGLLQQADEQYSRIVWEYKAKEAAIHADTDLFVKDSRGNPIMPTGFERLYRQVDIADKIKGSEIDVYSPDIRDSSLYNGLNNIKRDIEFQVGLEYGTLSYIAETAKTATEIKASKQRSYQTVKDIQNNLQVAQENLIYAMSILGQIAELPVKPVDLEKDVSFNWDDSIIIDKDTELLGMFNDVSSGYLKPEIYLAKKFGVSEEEAKKMMPKQVETKPSVFPEE
jgi:A118 family predicted phage portal protein